MHGRSSFFPLVLGSTTSVFPKDKESLVTLPKLFVKH